MLWAPGLLGLSRGCIELGILVQIQLLPGVALSWRTVHGTQGLAPRGLSQVGTPKSAREYQDVGRNNRDQGTLTTPSITVTTWLRVA